MPTSFRARRPGSAVVLLLLLLGGGLAAAAPPQDRALVRGQVEVEIRERGGGTSGPAIKFLMAMTEVTQSRMEAQSGQTRYRLRVSLSPRQPAPVLICELEMHGGTHEGYLKTSVPIGPGARNPVFSIVRPDGSRLEVLVSFR